MGKRGKVVGGGLGVGEMEEREVEVGEEGGKRENRRLGEREERDVKESWRRGRKER